MSLSRCQTSWRKNILWILLTKQIKFVAFCLFCVLYMDKLPASSLMMSTCIHIYMYILLNEIFLIPINILMHPVGNIYVVILITCESRGFAGSIELQRGCAHTGGAGLNLAWSQFLPILSQQNGPKNKQ